MELWNELNISNWLVFPLGATFVLYIYLDWKFKYWKRRGIPSPGTFGCLKQLFDILIKPVHENVIANYKKYGKIHGAFIGLMPQLSVADPHLLKDILVKDFYVFRNRVKIDLVDPLFSKILFFMQDEDWKRIRSIVSPTFSSGRMRKMANLVKECAQNVARHCEKMAEGEEEVDCKKCFNAFTVDVIATTAFGAKVNALENPDHPFVQNAKKFSNSDSSVLAAIFALFPQLLKLLKVDVFLGGVFKYFRHFTMQVIEERDKNNIRANDFLQLLLDAQRGQLEQTEDDRKESNAMQQTHSLTRHKTMSFDELLAQCILFYIAGGETTSSTLAVISYYLALHPECQRRLTEEIDDAWENNDEINFDTLNKMVYLDAVICEALRVQPVVVQLMRTTSESYTLGETGIKLDSNTIVVIPVYAMHRDPELFPDPEKFDPERFMPGNRQSIPPYTYLPFGDGPRNCIGMRFALMVLKFCVIYILRSVHMEATENTKKPLQFYKGKMVLQPKEVLLRMKKRR